MNTEITYTTVDTDALDFLKAIYFGVTTNAYEAAKEQQHDDEYYDKLRRAEAADEHEC